MSRDYDMHKRPSESITTLENILILKPYYIRIEKHTIIDEKSPFVLFALEIQSEYSKFIVLKQF